MNWRDSKIIEKIQKAKEAEIHAKEAADEKIAKEQIDDKLLEEKEADEVIDYSLQLHPNNTDALIFKIRSSFYYGYKEKARELFNRLEDPTDREVMFLKAEMLIDEKKYMQLFFR